jgi:hypothetical protein
VSDEHPREDGPTELVETDEGDVVERLSGGTATLLLVWLIGIGALSTLLAAWLFARLALGVSLHAAELFGGFGIYTAIAGAAGPCVLWLAGRAQGHSLGWFALTAAKIALVMVVIVALMVAGAALIMAGAVPGIGAILIALAMAVGAVLLSLVWAVATWAADRWIARARLDES